MQRVELEDFSGPLDLLLTLVQQEELSLTRIRLLEIVDQVLGDLEGERDLNDSGDLLIIISTLMELKSKLLLPGEVDIEEEIEALKEDLLAKVLVHRRLSQVLDALDYRFERRSTMFGRPAQLLDKETVTQPMQNQNPFVLFTSLADLLEQARQDSLRVEYDMAPIDHYFDWLEEQWSSSTFDLVDAMTARRDFLDATGVIIAVLELVRRGRLVLLVEPGRVRAEWREIPPDGPEEENDEVSQEEEAHEDGVDGPKRRDIPGGPLN